MPRVEANPTPPVLTWARTSSGLSPEDAAKKIGIQVGKLLAWETGTEKPTFAQLRKAGAVYKRPIAAFYLQEPPKGFEAMRDFRRHSGVDVGFVSPNLTQEIRRAHDRRDWALDLMAQLDDHPKDFKQRLRLNMNIEEAATQVRDFLGVTMENQNQWKTQAFSQWRLLIERAGILTFEMTTVGVEEARGFSIGAKPLPVAVANIKDSPRARIFTLLHEVAHILLDSGGICSLDDRGQDDSARSETFCNQISGATIFPREALLHSDIVRRHARGRSEWTDQELRGLSIQFGGSRESALVRLATLGLTSQAFCDGRRARFRLEYRQAEAERKAQQDKGFVPPHQLALLSAGPMFVGLVVENFNRERITTSDFSDYLQIRAKHISEVQQTYAGFGE
jgi:Zn-dependent peptidase ImmA (M78 family)/transcriptional regulator with XRE-family HTH domain